MKKICLIVALIAILTSCDQYYDMQYADDMAGHHLYYLPEFDTLHSYADIALWIKDHVQYDTEDNAYECKEPQQTIRSGKGSCADTAVLFVNIAYFALDQRLSVAYVDDSTLKARHIAEGGYIDHVMPYDGTKYVISQNTGRLYTADIGFYYHFDDIFIGGR